MARGRLLVTDDASVPEGGYALLRLTGVRQPPADLSLVVRRLAPPAFLAAGGWQTSEARVAAVASLRVEDGQAVLRLGPDIVDLIEPDEKIEIEVPALGLSERLVWPEEVRPSRLGSLGGGLVIAGRRPGEAPPPKPAEPLVARRDEDAPPTRPGPTPEEPPLTLTDPLAETQRPRRQRPNRRRLILGNLLGLLLLGLVLGGVWAYREGKLDGVLCDLGLGPCAPQWAALCPDTLPLTQLAECLLRSLPADQVFALAEQYGGQGKRDLALLLLQRLSAISHPGATLELALCYDPLLPDGCSLVPRLGANALQAARFYRQAGATEPLARLCAWLQGQSDLESEAVRQSYCQPPPG